MRRAFSFKAEAELDKEPELVINDESFFLDRAEEMTGLELLRLTGDTGTVGGVYRLLARAIKDDDWERFGKVTANIKQSDFYRIGGAIVDLYAGNPTTAPSD